MAEPKKTVRANRSVAKELAVGISAKRGPAERRGLHSWLPYYAGYSEAFVEDTIKRFALQPGAIILDPMNGSGTTSSVAQRYEFLAVGFDLNPAAESITRAKNRALASPDEVLRLVQSMLKLRSRELPPTALPMEGAQWISERAYRYLMAVRSARASISVKKYRADPRFRGLGFGESQLSIDVGALVEAAILRHVRRLCPPQSSKNPTWLKPSNPGAQEVLEKLDGWVRLAAEGATDLLTYFGTAESVSRFVSVRGDARSLSLPSESVDAVITSPPYLTRIDYAVGTSPELIALGYEVTPERSLRLLRQEIMGSTCIRAETPTPSSKWGGLCLETLNAVRVHPSHAALGYYYKTIAQYFADAERILAEVARVLKPGARAAFVVQDSWFKDILISLGEIYVEMGREFGLGATIDRSQVVRNHMGQLNSRSRKYRKGEVKEHVLIFEKRARRHA